MGTNTPYNKWHAALVGFIQSQKRGIQKKISQETKITPKHMNDIYKGRKRASQDLQLAIANAIGYTYEDMLREGAALLGREKEPFENYEKIMRLPIPDRAWAILRQAAEVHGVMGHLSAAGESRKPKFAQKFLAGEQDEVELYEESLERFAEVVIKIKQTMKEQGIQ